MNLLVFLALFHQQSIPEMMGKLHSFPTLREAGMYGIQRSYQCSHYYECGGVIAQGPDGRFIVGVTRTNFKGDSVALTHIAPPGYKVVADFHTHPCLPVSHYAHYFSPEDTANDTFNHVIGFLGDLCTGEVHEYDPSTMAPGDTQLEDDVFSTAGKIIGKIKVDGVSLEPDQGI
jgi:hypothetical protein